MGLLSMESQSDACPCPSDPLTCWNKKSLCDLSRGAGVIDRVWCSGLRVWLTERQWWDDILSLLSRGHSLIHLLCITRTPTTVSDPPTQWLLPIPMPLRLHFHFQFQLLFLGSSASFHFSKAELEGHLFVAQSNAKISRRSPDKHTPMYYKRWLRSSYTQRKKIICYTWNPGGCWVTKLESPVINKLHKRHLVTQQICGPGQVESPFALLATIQSTSTTSTYTLVHIHVWGQYANTGRERVWTPDAVTQAETTEMRITDWAKLFSNFIINYFINAFLKFEYLIKY